jgi:hypothetical protein
VDGAVGAVVLIFVSPLVVVGDTHKFNFVIVPLSGALGDTMRMKKS